MYIKTPLFTARTIPEAIAFGYLVELPDGRVDISQDYSGEYLLTDTGLLGDCRCYRRTYMDTMPFGNFIGYEDRGYDPDIPQWQPGQ